MKENILNDQTPKHIALFVKSFKGSGGAERVFLNLASGLVARGHRVDLVMARYEGHFLDQIPPEIRVVDLRVRSARQSLWVLPRLGKDTLFWAKMILARKPNYVLGALSGLVNYLKMEQPDVVIASMHYPNIVSVIAREIAQVKSHIILTIHNTLSQEIANSTRKRSKGNKVDVNKRLFPRADAVVAVSQGVADDLASTLSLPDETFTTIYNPVVTKHLEQQAVEPLIHPWFKEDGPPVLLAVGGLKPAKDHMTLLKAFALVRAELHVRLIILGEGTLREKLTRQAEELSISADLEMPGFVDNPYQYMAGASLFVLSSVFEGFGMVLVEALACGCPVVSTDCPNGPSEILEQGRFGTLVPMKDEHSMAKAIKHALKTPHDTARLISRGREFSLERGTENYLELINTFCGG